MPKKRRKRRKQIRVQNVPSTPKSSGTIKPIKTGRLTLNNREIKEQIKTKSQVKIKTKLSAEELHKIRIESARKGVETRRKRFETDPDYRKKMLEIYRKSGERLKQYNEQIKERMKFDPEFAKEITEKRKLTAQKIQKNIKERMLKDRTFREQMEENYRRSGERLRKWREEQEQADLWDEDEEYYTETYSDNDYETQESTVVYESLYQMCSQAPNEETANILRGYLTHFVLNVDGTFDNEALKRINASSSDLLSRAEGALYSSRQEEIYNNSIAVATLITDGDFDQEELYNASFKDSYHRFGGRYITYR